MLHVTITERIFFQIVYQIRLVLSKFAAKL